MPLFTADAPAVLGKVGGAGSDSSKSPVASVDSVTSAGSAAPLRLAGQEIWPPVVLAPMAGITNSAFRRLCAEFGAGLYVSEMITSRALVERRPETLRLIQFDEHESFRSLQLYTTDPATVRDAVAMIVTENLADHIDLNFGCPVTKVTRKGGGSALPWKTGLFREIIESAVHSAASLPVTIKMRKGIDDDHLTYLDAGRIAQDAGVAFVTLHGRTTYDMYSGHADWAAIARLKNALDIPVLGNGDIWGADDALRMMAETGCDGVVVGRGCLGRPWLFGDLALAMRGQWAAERGYQPSLGVVARALRRHTELLTEFFNDEARACRDIRKHIAWYFKGYPVGGQLRSHLALVTSLREMDELLSTLDSDTPYPGEGAEGQRGRAGSPRTPTLPYGWLESREINSATRVAVAAAEEHNSGG